MRSGMSSRLNSSFKKPNRFFFHHPDEESELHRSLSKLGLPISSHSFTNNFHTATPGALQSSAVTINSFGARGTLSRFNPASCGRRLPLRAFTALCDRTGFLHSSLPPRERGEHGRGFLRLVAATFRCAGDGCHRARESKRPNRRLGLPKKTQVFELVRRSVG